MHPCTANHRVSHAHPAPPLCHICAPRVVGVHKLLVLNFYPFLQKYIAPHQRDVTQVRLGDSHQRLRLPGVALRPLPLEQFLGPCHGRTPCAAECTAVDSCSRRGLIDSATAPLQVLAALVQAVHELVPPETLQPVLRQLVDQFVHDRCGSAHAPGCVGRGCSPRSLHLRLTSARCLTPWCGGMAHLEPDAVRPRCTRPTALHNSQGAARGDCGGPQDDARDLPQVPPAHGAGAAAGARPRRQRGTGVPGQRPTGACSSAAALRHRGATCLPL